MATDLTKDALLSLYREMVKIRNCEERFAEAHAAGLIPGACHTYVGEEAIAVGVCAHLNDDDAVFSTHRGHGHALAKGVHPRTVAAELLGRTSGCSQGRGGSMHLFAPEVGLMGTSGIVSPSILQATGAGYAFQLLKQDRVGVAFFGDGAVGNGAFHEGLNLATIWDLPVVFVCENNGFATEMSFAKASKNPDVGNRGPAYGLPSVIVDGNDLLAVYEAAGAAVERARDGDGPTLIECKTYRTRPHAEGMRLDGYRTLQEIDAWKARGPIVSFRKKVVDDGAAEEADFDGIDEEVGTLVGNAMAFAEDSPWPEPETASDFIYSSSSGPSDVIGGSNPTHERTFIEASLEALSAAMKEDPSIFVVGEGIGPRGGNFQTTAGLYDQFGPERLRDTPICERGFVGMCAGAAMTGARPIVDFMIFDFLLDAMGEMANQVAKMQYMSSGRVKMPIVFRGCIGVGGAAATHHSGNYYPLFMHLPGFRVVVPTSPADAKGLFATALHSDDPVLFLEHRSLVAKKGPVPEGDYRIPFGKARIARSGDDVTVVAVGSMVDRSLEAADELAESGVSIEVIDPRTLAPLDTDTIVESTGRTGRLAIVDETFAPCGVGAEIATQVGERGCSLKAPAIRISGLHTPTPYSPTLETAVVPQVEQIVDGLRGLMR